ncbi:MAG: hypothetical protein U0165_12400 [Polyangiaceae bacterium]
MDARFDSRVAQRLMQMRILWAALLMSQLLFAALMVFLSSKTKLTPPFPPEIWFAFMAGVASVQAVLSFIVPKRTFRIRVTTPRPRPGDPNEANVVLNAMLPAQTSFVMAWALGESVALDGFAFGYMGGPVLWAAPFFAVAMLMHLSRFPTVDYVLSLMRE